MTGCERCGIDLSTVDEIHAVEGQLYCSKECAIINQAEIIIASAKDAAIEWYDACAEVVAPEDIGLREDRR